MGQTLPLIASVHSVVMEHVTILVMVWPEVLCLERDLYSHHEIGQTRQPLNSNLVPTAFFDS